MKKFNYSGTDRKGRTVSGTTTAANEEEVRNQLIEFGFTDIQIGQENEMLPGTEMPEQAEEQRPDDFVQKLIDGDIQVGEPVTEEEIEEEEWRRAEVFARVRRYRRKENIVLAFTLVILGAIAAYFIYDKLTEVSAPQPEMVLRSSNEMLSLKDVYVKDQDLIFIVFARNWNGNVRVDFRAWDAFDYEIDSGTARLGFIGDHFGGSPEKSGTFRLKKNRFYERIEIIASGDEKR